MAGIYSRLIQSDPNYYGGIVFAPRIQPPINNECSSGGSWSTASEGSLDSCPPTRQPPLGYSDKETPGECAPLRYSLEEPSPQELGPTASYTPNNSLVQKQPQGVDKDSPGDRVPLRHFHQDFGHEQEEVTCRECCKCCKSWDDWCLFLSCNCASSPSLPMHERKCLRAARTEGWRLLWSFLIPLTVGSVPLQLVWAIAQFLVACTLFPIIMGLFSYGPYPRALSVYSLSKYSYGNGRVAGLASTSLWFLLCMMDVIVCLIVFRFFRTTFTSIFSACITALRVFYTSVCLTVAVIGYSFAQISDMSSENCTSKYCNCTVRYSSNNLYTGMFLYPFASIVIFVDVMLLVIAVRFALKSLKLRNTYTRLVNYNSAECYFVLHVFRAVIEHLFFTYCAFSILAVVIVRGSFKLPVERCEKNLYYFALATLLSLIVPSVGIISTYFLDYCRFQKYLINLYLSACHLVRNRARDDEFNIPPDLYNKLLTRLSRVQQVDIEQSQADAYLKHFFQNMSCTQELTYACFSPFSVFYSIVVLAMWSFFVLCIMWDTFSLMNAYGYFILIVIIGSLVLIHIHMTIVVMCALIYLVIASLFFGCFPLLAIIVLIIVLICRHHCRNYKCAHFFL